MVAKYSPASGRRKPPDGVAPHVRTDLVHRHTIGRLTQAARRGGLTLLELILALSLSVLVLMAVGMAIDLHYRMLDVRRTNVEESQLARATLRHMADDLRSAVQYVPPDLSGLDAMSSNMTGALSSLAANASGLSGQSGSGSPGGSSGQSGSGGQNSNGQTQQPSGGQSGQSGSGATQSGSGQSSGGTGTGQSTGGAVSGGQSTGTTATAEGETETATTTTSAVKLYGSLTELRLDISRLPRVDQYQALMNDSLGAVEIPSDVKTVVYFVRDVDSLGSPEPSLDGTGKGLMRSEIDRAVSSYAESGGDTTSLYAGGKLVAEEVTGLAFQYWDGVEWLPEWNSDDSGGLPLAVEIVMTIQPSRAMTEEEIADAGLSSKTLPPAEQTYRLVVHLPTAISTETRTLETEATDTAAATILPSEESGTKTADSGSSGGSGNSSGGGTGGSGGGTGGGAIGGGGRGDDRGGRGGGRGGDRGGDQGGGRNGDRPGGGGNPGPRPNFPPGPGPGPGPMPPGPLPRPMR